MSTPLANSQHLCSELIRDAFGEKLLVPEKLNKGPTLARFVAAITPQVASLRADHGQPTLGEELAHMLGSLEQYLRDAAPSAIGARPWGRLVAEGGAYEAFEQLRREAESAIPSIQPERELNYHWIGRPVRVVDVLWHVAGHTAHHRGRLAVLMRLCGITPPAT